MFQHHLQQAKNMLYRPETDQISTLDKSPSFSSSENSYKKLLLPPLIGSELFGNACENFVDCDGLIK